MNEELVNLSAETTLPQQSPAAVPDAAEKLSRRRLLCHHRQGREISSPGVRGRIRP